MRNAIRFRAISRLAFSLSALAMLAALPGAASAAPPPLDVGETRVLSAH